MLFGKTAVDKVGKNEAELDSAGACLETLDVVASHFNTQTVNDLFKRFNLSRETGIAKRESGKRDFNDFSDGGFKHLNFLLCFFRELELFIVVNFSCPYNDSLNELKNASNSSDVKSVIFLCILSVSMIGLGNCSKKMLYFSLMSINCSKQYLNSYLS